MAREIAVTAQYAGDPDTIFRGATELAELKDAMRAIARYDGLGDGRVTQGSTLVFDVTLFGILRTKGHTIYVETLDIPNRLIQSREHNPSVKRWDHTLTIQPGGPGAIWTDRVVIDAGWQSAMTARFAAFVYAHRHKKRKAVHLSTKIARHAESSEKADKCPMN